jgi:hypothetical protein
MSDHGPAQTLGVITHSGEPDELLAPLFSELFLFRVKCGPFPIKLFIFALCGMKASNIYHSYG